jgi:hypothetical protein
MTIKEMIARQSELTSLARSENRDLTTEETREFNELQGKIDAAKKTATPPPSAEGSKSSTTNGDEAVRQAVTKEKNRQAEISAMCRSFGIDPQSYLENDTSVETVARRFWRNSRRRTPPSTLAQSAPSSPARTSSAQRPLTACSCVWL